MAVALVLGSITAPAASLLQLIWVKGYDFKLADQTLLLVGPTEPRHGREGQRGG